MHGDGKDFFLSRESRRFAARCWGRKETSWFDEVSEPMLKDFAEKLPPTYRFLRGDGSFAVSCKKRAGCRKKSIQPVSAARRTPSFPDAVTAVGLRGRLASRKPAQTSNRLLVVPISIVKTKARFIQPMLLLRTEKLPQGPDWLMKSNSTAIGCWRLTAKERCRYGRAMITISQHAMDEEGRPSFNLLQNSSS